jgi:hypothetical protein
MEHRGRRRYRSSSARLSSVPLSMKFSRSLSMFGPYAEGDPAAFQGSVRTELREKLSRAGIIAMAVP